MSERQKILIVDDHVENLIALENTLSELDVEIVRASCGDEALAVSLKHDFAVAILDVMMPEMDGYELAQHIRGDEKTYVIPIVFLTASYDDELHMFKGYEAGAVDYIVKPYNSEVLLSKVRVFLELDRHRKRLETMVVERTSDLRERVKEVQCLSSISTLVAKPHETIDESLKAAVDLIPPGWQYPEITCARIVMGGRENTSSKFGESKWKQSADITLMGEVVASVEVFYQEEKPERDDGPFLKEEKNLITDIARQLGVMIQRDQAVERERHLDSVLRSIRSINQLIVKEKNRDLLIQKAPEMLVRDRGFLGAWIVLTKGDSEILVSSQCGLEDGAFQKMLDQFRVGKPPSCCRKAKESTESIAALSSSVDCEQCILGKSYRLKGAFVACLEYGSRKYGYFSVATPTRFIEDKEELSLFREIAGDISYALHAIENEKERLEAHQIINMSPAVAFLWKNAEGWPVEYVSENVQELFGYSVEEFTEGKVSYAEIIHPRDLERVGNEVAAYSSEKKRMDFAHEPYRIVTKGGEVKWIDDRTSMRKDENGEITHFQGVVLDITDHMQAEKALVESEMKFRSMFENMAAACCLDEVIYKDGKAVDYRLLDVNPAFEKITGISRSQAVGALASQLYGTPEIAYLDVYAKVAETGEPVSFESYFPSLEKHLQVTSSCPSKGMFSNVFTDITEAKRAEEEKAKLQEQLNQSQKLESIGRLAGGVAHDFNNLLTAITGFSDLIFDSLNENDPLRDDVLEIQKAADSAATLTQQLLAFSRKQLVSPKIVNLNKAVAQLEKMLRRIIGEDIDFVFLQSEYIGKVRIDPGQIDQILVNLAVNSRDAMPGVGSLTIEIKNLTLDVKRCQTCLKPICGDYVMIAVSDTGAGIDKNVLVSIFEPFFTTKEKGKGTGLGLSTVHGIVHQNEGHVNVYSEPGIGTTFKIYLPRIFDEADAIAEPINITTLTGSETILLVEDMQIVRNLAARILKEQGYQVIEAEHGGEALIKCEEAKGEIDLLLTDVILPQMSGKQLYSRLLKTKPDLKVLFMSGYTENAIAHHGVLDQGTNFLQKPFRPQELAVKVREVIDTPLPVITKHAKSLLDKKTVLIVDDDENLRTVFSEFLKMSGGIAVLARNAAEGMNFFKENRGVLSAVILDETLPDGLGHLVLQDMRDIDPKIPIILTSGYSSNEIDEVIKNIEAVSFLPKPFVRKDLLTALGNVLDGKE